MRINSINNQNFKGFFTVVTNQDRRLDPKAYNTNCIKSLEDRTRDTSPRTQINFTDDFGKTKFVVVAGKRSDVAKAIAMADIKGTIPIFPTVCTTHDKGDEIRRFRSGEQGEFLNLNDMRLN